MVFELHPLPTAALSFAGALEEKGHTVHPRCAPTNLASLRFHSVYVCPRNFMLHPSASLCSQSLNCVPGILWVVGTRERVAVPAGIQSNATAA